MQIKVTKCEKKTIKVAHAKFMLSYNTTFILIINYRHTVYMPSLTIIQGAVAVYLNLYLGK